MNDPGSQSPLPSEAAMFRVVVGLGIALLPVFALSVIAGPGWAAILLGFEIGVALGILWRRRRATRAPGE